MGELSKSKKEKRYIILAALLCAASVIAMTVALMLPEKPVKGEFIPPELEAGAVSGSPEVPKELGYMEPYAQGMTFYVGVCGRLEVKEGSADVYFTNKAENDVWIMLRVTDEQGNALASTGLLKPGEYVKTIRFDKIPADGQKVVYKIMAYEPVSYYSMGYFKISTVAHVN